jgi:hypothetical protein
MFPISAPLLLMGEITVSEARKEVLCDLCASVAKSN